MPTIELREDDKAAELRRQTKRSSNNRQMRHILALQAEDMDAWVDAIRRGDAQTAQEIHRSHRRRWARELSDLLDRMPGIDEGRSDGSA